MLRIVVSFILFIVVIPTLFSQRIYYSDEKDLSLLKFEENLEYFSDSICLPAEGKYFSVNSTGNTYFIAVQKDTLIEISKYNYTTNEYEPFYSLSQGSIATSFNGFNLVKDSLLIVVTTGTIFKLDIESKELTEIATPDFPTSAFNPFLTCFDCLDKVYCNSWAINAENRMWEFILEQDSLRYLYDFTPLLLANYGCVGIDSEFAKWVIHDRERVRVYSWTERQLLYETSVIGGAEECNPKQGLAVKNYPFHLLSFNDKGPSSARTVEIEIDLCDTKKISLEELGLAIVNEGVPIDSMMIKVLSAPEDFYMEMETSNILVLGDVTDSIVIYNTEKLSNDDLVAEITKGFFRLDSIPQVDTISIEISMNSFLYMTAKKIDLIVEGVPPCDEWGVSNSELTSEDVFFIPNPTSDYASIRDRWIGHRMHIVNSIGEVLYSRLIDKREQDFSTLPSGVYFIYIVGKGLVDAKVIKLVKM